MRAADDAVAALVRLAGAADLSPVEITALVYEVAERAGVGVRDIRAMLKAAAAEPARSRIAAARERAMAERSDPRPLKGGRQLDAEWLPVVGALDAVAGAVDRVRRPRRDIDSTLMRERRMPIAHTHAFTTANEEGGDP